MVFRNRTLACQAGGTEVFWRTRVLATQREGSPDSAGGRWKRKRGFTMEWWARRTAWQAWNRATASSLFRCQLLLDLFQPRTLLESAHAVHHAGWHVCSDTGLAAVRIDGEDVGSAPQRADHNPATVMAEGDILYLENWDVKWKCSHPCTRTSERKWTSMF